MDTIPEITQAHQDLIQVYQDLVQSQQSSYEQLLQSQQSNFHLLLAVFIALIIVFIGASWVFSVKIAKEQLKSETQKIFDETNKIINDFKKEFESESNLLWAEIFRAFYVSLSKNEDLSSKANRISYVTGCIEYYKLANKGESLKIAVMATLAELKSVINIKDKFNKTFNEIGYDYNEILRRIDFIPGELCDEKKEIQQLIEKLEKEDGKKEKPQPKT